MAKTTAQRVQPVRIDYQRWVLERVSAVAAEWWQKQGRDVYASLYLYYRPSTPELPGALAVAEDAPAGYVLADGRRLQCGWTIEQARYHIADVSRRLPILPYQS